MHTVLLARILAMPPRVRRTLFTLAFLGLACGCAHRSPVSSRPGAGAGLPEVAASGAGLLSRPPVGRVTSPGTPFTRAEHAAPFAPSLVVTTQVAHDDFLVHGLGAGMPRYLSPERIQRGQRVFILPFAQNYARAANGRTDLTYELEVLRPDGTRDGGPLAAVLWQERVATPGLLLYPATTLSFWVEAGDPLGVYVLTVRVTDHLAGETKELTRRLVLEDYATPALPADFAAHTWFGDYYREPTPELALPALPRLFLNLPSDQRDSALPRLLGFYDQILADNAWLLPAFCARLAEAGPDEAYLLSVVLGHHLRAATQPPAGVDPVAWLRLEDFRTYGWPSDPDTRLTLATQLDTLWGRFFASGLYAPIERMLASLESHADLGATDRWQKLRADAGLPVDLSPEALSEAADPAAELSPDAPPPEVLRDIVLRTAIWSLRGNAREHPLVHAYLDWTLRLGDMPATQKNLLARILRPEPSAPTALAR